VRPGDRLSVHACVAAVRPSRSKPQMGSVHMDYTVSNQRGEAVMTFKGIGILMRRNPATNG